MSQPKKPLILIGFMGTGKTTVGKALAVRLGLPLVDTDQEIERTGGETDFRNLSEVGEEGFRELESRVLRQVLTGNPGIVTTGGGIVLRPENVRLMKEFGLVIALHASAGGDYSAVVRRYGPSTAPGRSPAARFPPAQGAKRNVRFCPCPGGYHRLDGGRSGGSNLPPCDRIDKPFKPNRSRPS